MNRVSRKISAIYTGFLFAISISIFIVLITVLLLHYEGLIHWIIQKLRKPELEVLLRNRVFTPAKFRIVQNISLAGLIALPLLVFVFIKMKNRLLERIFFLLQIFRGAFSSWNKVFASQSRLEKISFYTALLLIAVRSIFYILTRDLQYDEMWSYNYYTASPFYFSFLMYNNYPLYEIATHLFNWLPFSGKINIRLPVFIAGLGACSVLYFYLLKFFKNPFPALAAMILFAFLPPVTSYMFYGRGVMFEVFFAIIALFSLLQWLDAPDRNDQFLFFIFANILGVYSMPGHIYFWICLDVFAWIYGARKKHFIGKLALANLAILLGIFICYLPVLAGSGISFLTDALKPALTSKAVWNVLPAWLGNFSYFVTGFPLGLSVVLVLGLAMIIIPGSFSSFQKPILFSCLLCILPAIINLLQRMNSHFRVLTFIELAPVLMLAIILQVFGSSLNKKIQYAFCLLLGISGSIICERNTILNWSRNQDRHVKELSAVFIKKDIRTCYDNSQGSQFSYYYPGLEYYYRQAGKSIRLTPGNPRSLRYKPWSAEDHYDCLVNPVDSLPVVQPENYKSIYRLPEEKFEVFQFEAGTK
jgi:hypothetical protein